MHPRDARAGGGHLGDGLGGPGEPLGRLPGGLAGEGLQPDAPAARDRPARTREGRVGQHGARRGDVDVDAPRDARAGVPGVLPGEDEQCGREIVALVAGERGPEVVDQDAVRAGAADPVAQQRGHPVGASADQGGCRVGGGRAGHARDLARGRQNGWDRRQLEEVVVEPQARAAARLDGDRARDRGGLVVEYCHPRAGVAGDRRDGQAREDKRSKAGVKGPEWDHRADPGRRRSRRQLAERRGRAGSRRGRHRIGDFAVFGRIPRGAAYPAGRSSYAGRGASHRRARAGILTPPRGRRTALSVGCGPDPLGGP